MNIFIENTACKSSVHCATCRDKRDGRSFRESLGNAFILPNDAPDFECPHGKEWGYKPKQTVIASTGIGDTIAKITSAIGVKPCGGCQKRKEALNKLIPYKDKT